MIIPYIINGPLSCEDNNPLDELHNSEYYYTSGLLKSYRWELDEVNYLSSFTGYPFHAAVVRYVDFPLRDKLHITFNKGHYFHEETWEVFNWQVKEHSFNIIDFISIGWPNNHPTGHAPVRIYQNEIFKLAKMETYCKLDLEHLNED